MRLRGQAVKTSPFHGGNTGSIPVGVIGQFSSLILYLRELFINKPRGWGTVNSSPEYLIWTLSSVG